MRSSEGALNSRREVFPPEKHGWHSPPTALSRTANTHLPMLDRREVAWKSPVRRRCGPLHVSVDPSTSSGRERSKVTWALLVNAVPLTGGSAQVYSGWKMGPQPRPLSPLAPRPPDDRHSQLVALPLVAPQAQGLLEHCTVPRCAQKKSGLRRMRAFCLDSGSWSPKACAPNFPSMTCASCPLRASPPPLGMQRARLQHSCGLAQPCGRLLSSHCPAQSKN
mmetsp:Transcript_128642/g.320835  ORF Transcript_128642/g.320835 Transcript_128642/m.320835 type:complete len:221 (+) Transcript_128642:483-1145(+)